MPRPVELDVTEARKQQEEPFGLVNMEVAAAGSATTGVPWEAAPELIRDDVTGILCGDEDDMIAAIARTTEFDPAAYGAHSAGPRNPSVIARQHLDLFRRICAAPDDGFEPDMAKRFDRDRRPRPQRRATTHQCHRRGQGYCGWGEATLTSTTRAHRCPHRKTHTNPSGPEQW